MRLGHLELITLLNFCCGEQSLRDVKEKCPHFWSSVSALGHATSFFGLSSTNWWKERYLFHYVISELSLYLSLIFNRSFTFRDERQLELIWQAVSSNCSMNQSFFKQVISVFPQIEDLVKAPFPKFSLVRRAYEKSNLKRGFQVLAWNDNETLTEYETRIARITGTSITGTSTGKKDREEFAELHANELGASSRHMLLKHFRSLQAKSAQLEKELGKLSLGVKQMLSDAVTIRFEAHGVFVDIEKCSTRFQQIVALAGTLHLDLQEIEIGQRLNDEANAPFLISSLDTRMANIFSLFDEWKKEKNDLQNVLRDLFEELRSRIRQLYTEIDTYSRLDHAPQYNEIFKTHIQDSMNMIKEYEKALLRPPGPVLLIQNIEAIVHGNLNFLKKVQNYFQEAQKQVNK